VKREFIVPFILVTSLFFLWGVAYSLFDVLKKHFQDILGITKARSGLVQSALYGAYFIMAVPAGLSMNRLGFKRGIITVLLLYATGVLTFWPATAIQTFECTLLCLFIIACDLTFLETAANPYSSVLDPKDSLEQRLNLSQSFNGLGWPSLIALYLNYFCMSIMFSTIFVPGLKDLEGMTKKASSVLVMTIVAGAICPVIMDCIADLSGMASGFVVPFICFAFIAWYAFFRAKSPSGE
jgi:fucose permease